MGSTHTLYIEQAPKWVPAFAGTNVWGWVVFYDVWYKMFGHGVSKPNQAEIPGALATQCRDLAGQLRVFHWQ